MTEGRKEGRRRIKNHSNKIKKQTKNPQNQENTAKEARLKRWLKRRKIRQLDDE